MKKAQKILATAATFLALLGSHTTAQASGVLVGQCVQNAPCYNATTAWSSNLSFTDLASLGLGTSQAFIADQTSQFIIRLGVTTMTFNTSTGTVTESLGEFNGLAQHLDPGPYETDLVGSFFIPANALSATISGTFGNSVVSSSAGTDLWLGEINHVNAVPEPETYAMFIAGLSLLGVATRRRNKPNA